MEARENNFKSIVTNENLLDIPFFKDIILGMKNIGKDCLMIYTIAL